MHLSLSDIPPEKELVNISCLVRPLSTKFLIHPVKVIPCLTIYADCLQCPIWKLPGQTTRVPDIQGIVHFITYSLELALKLRESQ